MRNAPSFQQRLEKALAARDVLFRQDSEGSGGTVDGPVVDVVLAVEAVLRDAVRSRYRRGIWLRLLGVEERCIATRGDGAVCGKKPGHLGEHYFEAGA